MKIKWLIFRVVLEERERRETFRFNDDNEYEILTLSFFAYSKNIDSPESFILPFFTRKVSTVIFRERGYTLSQSQDENIFNI